MNPGFNPEPAFAAGSPAAAPDAAGVPVEPLVLGPGNVTVAAGRPAEGAPLAAPLAAGALEEVAGDEDAALDADGVLGAPGAV